MKLKRISMFIIIAVLVMIAGLTLTACDDDIVVKTPSHITFEVPDSSFAEPISLANFKYSDIKLYVVYDDGTKGTAISFDPSMVTNDALEQIELLEEGKTLRVKFEAQYSVNGQKMPGSFSINFKKPDSQQTVDFKFYTNGATIGDFVLAVPVGTTFNTYEEFAEYIYEKMGNVTKTRYTLKSWYDTQNTDPKDLTEDELLNESTPVNSKQFRKITANMEYIFYATWEENLAEVTFNYYFTHNNQISSSHLSNIYLYHRTFSINTKNNTGDKFNVINQNNTIVKEYYTMGYDSAQRPKTYEYHSGTLMESLNAESLMALEKPLQEVIPGYTFDGWCTDEALTQTWSFNETLKDDITLYAKWSKKEYKISFDLGGGLLGDKFYLREDCLCENGNSESNIVGDIERFDSELTNEAGDAIPSVVAYTKLNYVEGIRTQSNLSMRYLLKSEGEIQTNNYIYKGKIGDTNTYYYTFAGWYLDPLFETKVELDETNLDKDLYFYAKWDLNALTQTAFYKDYLFNGYLELKDDGTYKITGIADKTITSLRVPVEIGGVKVTEIGDNAFQSCLSLLSVEIVGGESSRLATIGNRAFAYCSKLAKIEKIGVSDDGGIETVISRADVLSVGDGSTMDRLRSLGYLQNIGIDVFQGTKWLTNYRRELSFITLNGTLIQYIGDSTVTNIITNESYLPEIGGDGENSLDSTYELKEIKNTQENHIVMYQYTASQKPTYNYVVLPSGIVSINPYAFKNLTSLQSIKIPNTVKTVSDYAFAKCVSLTSFSVEPLTDDGSGNTTYYLESLGSSALADTQWIDMESSRIQNFIVIGKILYAYKGSNSVTTANIPAGIEIIADNLFNANSALRTITFGDEAGIKKIGANAFNSTQWYANKGTANNGFVIVNNILIGYNKRPVADSYGRYVINVPNGVKSIASYAFANYSIITHICLPNTVEKIEEYAFEACTKLQSISFEHVVTLDEGNNEVKPYILTDGLSLKAFFNSKTNAMVSKDMKIYLTPDAALRADNTPLPGGISCYTYASTNSACPLYIYYAANNDFLQSLKVTAIKVKEGTLENEYVRSSGWSLQSYWTQTGAFSNKAIIQLYKSDGLIYEDYLTQAMISNIDSSLSSSKQILSSDGTLTYPYGYNVYDTVKSFTITYTNSNGKDFICTFDYLVRPEISSITVTVDANSFMRYATYYTTSKSFVYEGGNITINYKEIGVESQTISIAKLISNNKFSDSLSAITALLQSNDFNVAGDKAAVLELINSGNFQIAADGTVLSDTKQFKGAIGAKFKIKNFQATSAQLYNVTMEYTLAGQVATCDFEYQVNRPQITNIEAQKPIEFDIASVMNKSEMSDVILVLSRKDAINGGQIYLVNEEGIMCSFANIPASFVISKYFIYYPLLNSDGKLVYDKYGEIIYEKIMISDSVCSKYYATTDSEGALIYSEQGDLVFDTTTIESVDIKEFLNIQNVSVNSGTILLYNDAKYTEKLTTFDTSTAGIHYFYAKYNDDSGAAIGDSKIEYNVLLRTSQSMFGYEIDKETTVSYNGETIDPVTNKGYFVEDGITYINNGIATITDINNTHWSTVSIPEVIKLSEQVKVLNEDGTDMLDENGEVVYETKYYFYVVTSIKASAFADDTILQKIYFGENVTSIGNYAFKGCANLHFIGLTNELAQFGVTTIGNNAFEGCSALTQIPFNSNLVSIGAYAFKNSGLTQIDFSVLGVTEIEIQTFYGCSSLSSVNLEGIEVLNNQVFEGCTSLTSITIPTSVNEMGDYVFNACINLSTVNIQDTTPENLIIGAGYTFGTQSSLIIYVASEEAKTAFIANECWAIYSSKIAII